MIHTYIYIYIVLYTIYIYCIQYIYIWGDHGSLPSNIGDFTRKNVYNWI